jgi:hypothetical protein
MNERKVNKIDNAKKEEEQEEKKERCKKKVGEIMRETIAER